MPLSDSHVVLHADPRGVLGDACNTQRTHQTDRRRLHAIRLHHHDLPCNKRGGQLAPRLHPELLPEAKLGAYDDEVLKAHVQYQDHHVDAGSKLYWSRQSYAQKLRGTSNATGIEPLPKESTVRALEFAGEHSSIPPECHRGTVGELMNINVRPRRHAAGLRNHRHASMGLDPWLAARTWAADEHPGAELHRQKEQEHHYRTRALANGDVDNKLTAELHRRIDQHHLQDLTQASDEIAENVVGGATLVRCVQTAETQEVIRLAPLLEAYCFEAPKEEALLAAVRLGTLAKTANDPAEATVLQQAMLALFASVTARARDAHSLDFLVEALEAMHAAGMAEPTHVESVLATIYAQLSRTPLSLELARRAASALMWATTAGVSLHLGAGSRRAVVAIRRAINDGPSMENDDRLLAVLDDLSTRRL